MLRLSSALSVLTLFLAACSRTSERFPTEDYKRFPLAMVCEVSDGSRSVRFAPYREPGFVREWNAMGSEFKQLTFPIPETATDKARFFSGIAYSRDLIPQGHDESQDTETGKTRSCKFVFSANGRLKNVHFMGESGSQGSVESIIYDDGGRRICRVSTDKGSLTGITVGAWSSTGVTWDVTRPPSRLARLNSEGVVTSWEEFENPWVRRYVHLPDPAPLEKSKWPCQADRYLGELRDVLSAPGISGADRVRKILRYTQLEPMPNEEDWRGGNGYPNVRRFAVECLGGVRCKEAHQALLRLLEDRRFRGTAADALAHQNEPEALPFLLKALEAEDTEALSRPSPGLVGNRHLVIARIAEAMLKLAPAEAKSCLQEFLQTKKRTFADTIAECLQRAK